MIDREITTSEHPEVSTEELLSRVDPQIVEALGEDTISSIEAYGDALVAVEGLTSSENPFGIDRPSEIDLSFMDPKAAALIEKGDPSKFDGTTLWALARYRRRIIKVGNTTGPEIYKRKESVRSSLIEHIDKVNEVFSDVGEEGGERFDIAQTLAFMESLFTVADKLPTESTLRVFENIYKTEIRTSKLFTRRWLGRRAILAPRVKKVPKLSQKLYGYLEEIAKNASELSHQTREVRRLGSGEYKRLIQLVGREKPFIALEILAVVNMAKVRLPVMAEQLTETEVEATLKAELYLARKASEVETILQELKPDTLRNPEVKSAINYSQATKLADHLRANRDREDQLKTQVLNSQVTETRDILRGGRRLYIGRDSAEKIADALHGLRPGEEKDRKLLEPEESGIIVSILANKFDVFIAILERVKMRIPDEALSLVQQSRPEAIGAIKNFDAGLGLRKIWEVINNAEQCRALANVLSYEEIQKIRSTLTPLFVGEEAPEQATV